MDVILAGEPRELVLPQSFSIRWDITIAFSDNPSRAGLAALAVCLDHEGIDKRLHPKVSIHQAKSVWAFGGAYLDQLMAPGRGLRRAEVFAAARIAVKSVIDSIPAEEEVARSEAQFPSEPSGPVAVPDC